MNLVHKIFSFCRIVAQYDGPQEVEAVDRISKFEYKERETALNRAFELGYKRGYADCAEYVADWIEDEDEEA